MNSISDNEEEDDQDEFSDGEDVIENNELPEHEFITIEKIVKSGKYKGNKKYTTTLMIPPYAFKRKTDRKVGGNAIFTCNSCAKLGYTGISATAVKLSENEDGKSEYELLKVPTDHKCVLNSNSHLKKKFVKSLCEEVAKNPLKPVGQIYEEVRSRFTTDMDNEDDRMLFLSDIPNLKAINSDLYKYRKEFIPKAPLSQAEFNVTNPWFQLNSGETIVRGDIYVKGGRVLVFSCKESLKILARCAIL